MEFAQELQLIAVETHRLLQSTKEDDPNRIAIVSINHAVGRAIQLLRELSGFDDLGNKPTSL